MDNAQTHAILDTRHTTYKPKTQYRNTQYWIQDTTYTPKTQNRNTQYWIQDTQRINQKHKTETRNTGYKTHNV
jgi:hypothetical protein